MFTTHFVTKLLFASLVFCSHAVLGHDAQIKVETEVICSSDHLNDLAMEYFEDINYGPRTSLVRECNDCDQDGNKKLREYHVAVGGWNHGGSVYWHQWTVYTVEIATPFATSSDFALRFEDGFLEMPNPRRHLDEAAIRGSKVIEAFCKKNTNSLLTMKLRNVEEPRKQLLASPRQYTAVLQQYKWVEIPMNGGAIRQQALAGEPAEQDVYVFESEGLPISLSFGKGPLNHKTEVVSK